MANIVYATTQNTVKKQLNDLWLNISMDLHKDLYSLSVERVSGTYTSTTPTTASGPQLKFAEITGSKPYEKGTNGHSGLDQTDGEAVLLVVRKPLGPKDVTITMPITTVVGGVFTSGTCTVKVEGYAGRNQATYLGQGAIGTDIILENVSSIGDGTAGGGISVTGAQRGDNFKFVSMPKTWREQSFVRTITPNIPKNYAEVADHYDGSADTIRVTTIDGLTFSKVFEDMPGSFMMLTDRVFTVKAEVRENDSSVASEVHFFVGVRGTGRVNFNRDGESITEAECSMADWIHVTKI